MFGRELREAREACLRYRVYGETSDLDKAWDIYYAVRALKGRNLHLPQLSFLGIQEN